jgi:hypothetical protein
MTLQPASGYNPEAAECPSGLARHATLLSDDLEGGASNWTFAAEVGTSSWVLATGYTHAGTGMLWGIDAFPQSDSYAAMASEVLIPPGAYRAHSFGFEDPIMTVACWSTPRRR